MGVGAEVGTAVVEAGAADVMGAGAAAERCEGESLSAWRAGNILSKLVRRLVGSEGDEVSME